MIWVAGRGSQVSGADANAHETGDRRPSRTKRENKKGQQRGCPFDVEVQ